jgi:hypothetical protein
MNLTRTVAAVAATVLVSGLGVATTTSATQAAGTFTVTATVSQAEPEQGETIKIKGLVSPARPGSTVVLQKKYADQEKWKKVGTDKPNAKGRFKFTDKVDSVRSRQYRVVKSAEGGRSAGRSAKLGVTVFGWRYLTSLGSVSGSGTYETGSVNINAKPYENSIVGVAYDDEGSIAYNLDRKCKEFSSRVGVGDSSEITSTGTVTLKADTTSFYTNSFALTESAPVTHDVTGVFRITMDWTSSNTEGTPEDQSGAVVALGSPRLLCSS